MSGLDGLIKKTVEKFRKRVEEDEELRNELQGVVKRVNIEVTGGEGYGFVLDNAEIKDLAKGGLDDPDITISATEEDLIALFKGELRPMKAWATKRLRLRGDLADLLRFRKFL
jgi:putative sterol carrier protein